jgi:hypothetical protein
MKMRQLVINQEQIFEWFTEGRKTFDYIVAGGIPADTHLAGIKFNPDTKDITFILANEAFRESKVIKNLQISITGISYDDSLSSLDDESSLGGSFE